MHFFDRKEAGACLADSLLRYASDDPIVIALPRGGVPVAAAVADALRAPLEVLVVRKLCIPSQPELGIGAIAEGGGLWIHPDADIFRKNERMLAAIAMRETAEIRRRIELYRHGRELPDLHGRTVILVDDGVATCATAQVAIRAIRNLGPARLVFATPVASEASVAAIRAEVDDMVCIMVPDELLAIGDWYRDFPRVTDDEVIECLENRCRTSSNGKRALTKQESDADIAQSIRAALERDGSSRSHWWFARDVPS